MPGHMIYIIYIILIRLSRTVDGDIAILEESTLITIEMFHHMIKEIRQKNKETQIMPKKKAPTT